MKYLLLLVMLSTFAFGQTPTQPPAPTPFPTLTLPSSVALFGTYNQLGSPRWTMGAAVLYPFGTGTMGIYGSTIADMYPKLTIDPTTQKNFYSLSMSFRQGLHKYMFGTGRWAFLVGGDVGPSFGTINTTTSGTSINFSSSIILTTVYQISPAFSLVLPLRLLYVDGSNTQSKWNPIVEAGFAINLNSLAKSKVLSASH